VEKRNVLLTQLLSLLLMKHQVDTFSRSWLSSARKVWTISASVLYRTSSRLSLTAAAAAAAVVCQGGITMKNYNSRMEVSWVNEELERVRNIRPGFRWAGHFQCCRLF
jgi:hypothetical protein